MCSWSATQTTSDPGVLLCMPLGGVWGLQFPPCTDPSIQPCAPPCRLPGATFLCQTVILQNPSGITHTPVHALLHPCERGTRVRDQDFGGLNASEACDTATNLWCMLWKPGVQPVRPVCAAKRRARQCPAKHPEGQAGPRQSLLRVRSTCKRATSKLPDPGAPRTGDGKVGSCKFRKHLS